jgi:hypothetical protein
LTSQGYCAENKIVVIPLWKTKIIEGNAVAADVLNRKTFSTADGVHTGIRPPAPIGTDYVGKGVHAPDPRFTMYHRSVGFQAEIGYGVKDLMTGLIWTQSPSSSKKSWANAVASCENLETSYVRAYGGRSISVEDWRMPTVREMNSLLAYSRGSGQIAGSNALVIPNFFTDVHSNIYWTDSLADSLCSDGQGGFYRCKIDFTIDLRYATVNHEVLDPNDQSPPQHYCWCVRGPYGIEY